MTGEDADTLYEKYLDACLDGRIEPPSTFCDREGAADPSLALRLEALYALHRGNVANKATPASDIDAAPGLPFERLGEFRLLKVLGEGGMGTLYLAEQESLGRRVALKVMLPELRASPTTVERFRREALAIAHLQHPNIVNLHATGEDQGVLYLVMELVPGTDLKDLLESARRAGRPLAWRRAVGWAARIARALESAHAAGVLHRDVKPGNIRIRPDEEPVLLDFGVARDDRWAGKTLTREFAGSFLYAAPEQLAGRAVDGRADVYSLGATLYEALTGRPPFPDSPGDDLLRRVFDEEPLAPRRLEPSLPRDVDVVVLKALEKNPRQRYASAAEFADDLEAVLAGRSIAARPPGPLKFLHRRIRRRPVVASMVAALLLFVVVLGVLDARQRSERHRDARTKLAAARVRLEEYKQSRATLRDVEERLHTLQAGIHTRHTTDDEDRLLERNEDRVREAQREREAAFYEVLNLLRRAGELDPDLPTDDVRAELYLQRWHEARARRDPVAEQFYLDLVNEHDTPRRFHRELHGRCETAVNSTPPGAQVYFFRLDVQADVVPGGEHRRVPVPFGGTPAAPPGTFALRVMTPAGEMNHEDLVIALCGHPILDSLLVLEDRDPLRRGDRLASIDAEPARSLFVIDDLDRTTNHVFVFERAGEPAMRIEAKDPGAPIGSPAQLAQQGGVVAVVVRDGQRSEQTLPAGLVVSTTAAPLFTSPDCLVGTTPTKPIEIEAGHWMFVVRHEGYHDMRYCVWIEPGTPHCRPICQLIRRDAGPAGFFPVHHEGRFQLWMMQGEITAAEYLEFLNDPATLAEIDGADEPIRFPRDPTNQADGGDWPRLKDGRFAIADDWLPDWPMLGVSWHDAQAYAEWRTARDPRFRYGLPTRAVWDLAGSAGSPRDFPFGDRFRPKWVKSCYAQRRALPEPVMRYPIDESPLGFFDMAGSAMEWLDDLYDEGRGLRSLGGGSWAHAKPEAFELWGTGMRPQSALGVYGFRLVAESKP